MNWLRKGVIRSSESDRVAPFYFTEDQIKELLFCWKRESDKKKSVQFIKASECFITMQLRRGNRTKDLDKKEKLQGILETTKKLHRELSEIQPNLVSSINASSSELLMKNKHHMRLNNFLKGITKSQYPNLLDTNGLLTGILCLLIDSIEKTLANTAVNPGPNKINEVFFVGELKKIYFRKFEKPPGVTPETPFYLYIKKLEELDEFKKAQITIGRDVIQNS